MFDEAEIERPNSGSAENHLAERITPPPVLISPVHIEQMREKRRQIEALRNWAAATRTETAVR